MKITKILSNVSTIIGLVIVLMSGKIAIATTFTTINPDSFPSSPSLLGDDGILDLVYGLENVKRVADNQDIAWRYDQTVGSPFVVARVIAKFGGFDIGNFEGVANGGTFPLIGSFAGDSFNDRYFSSLNTTFGTNVFSVEDVLNGAGKREDILTFSLDSILAGMSFSSDPSKNADLLDHMVTFEINGGNPGSIAGDIPNVRPTYVLAWDDQLDGGDRDFNDLVIEVVEVSPIPEPHTIFLLFIGLIGLFYGRQSKLFR